MSNILIVEDNEIIRGGLVKMAKKVDSSVHIFETGSAKEALEYASDNEIKALFLDIHFYFH